jgi:hypothetical protein
MATIGLILATGVLAWVAWYQIGAARDEAKLNRTLAACDRYDLDPVLDACSRRLAEVRNSGDLQNNVKAYRLDIFSVLNYLESIAIGIEQGLYDKKLVREYMEPIFVGCIEEYVTSGVLKPIGFEPVDFSKSVAICKEWA